MRAIVNTTSAGDRIGTRSKTGDDALRQITTSDACRRGTTRPLAPASARASAPMLQPTSRAARQKARGAAAGSRSRAALGSRHSTAAARAQKTAQADDVQWAVGSSWWVRRVPPAERTRVLGNGGRWTACAVVAGCADKLERLGSPRGSVKLERLSAAGAAAPLCARSASGRPSCAPSTPEAPQEPGERTILTFGRLQLKFHPHELSVPRARLLLRRRHKP